MFIFSYKMIPHIRSKTKLKLGQESIVTGTLRDIFHKPRRRGMLYNIHTVDLVLCKRAFSHCWSGFSHCRSGLRNAISSAPAVRKVYSIRYPRTTKPQRGERCIIPFLNNNLSISKQVFIVAQIIVPLT